MPVTISNDTLKAVKVDDPSGRLAPLSRILNSEIAAGFSVDTGSCVNRCRVGKHFGFGCYSYIADTEIGRYCTFASRVSVGPFNHPVDWLSIHEFQYRNLEALCGDTIVVDEQKSAFPSIATTIGSDVWIGDNAAVRRGVRIGHGAIIGMGAVVVRDVPPYAIVVGNPGRIARYRFPPDVIEQLLELRWWELDLAALKGVDFRNIHHAIAALRERMGEIGVACIVLRNDAMATADELVAFCAGKLARFKIPRHVVFLRGEEIPTTPSGRARKFLLADIVRERLNIGKAT